MNTNHVNRTVGNILRQLGGAIQHQPKHFGPRPPRTFFAQKPVAHHHQQSLPKFMGNLDVKCPNHFAPMPTTFVRFTQSDKGAPIAHYKCSCGKSYFYALNAQGQAFMLFSK